MQRGLVGSEMCIRDRYMGKMDFVQTNTSQQQWAGEKLKKERSTGYYKILGVRRNTWEAISCFDVEKMIVQWRGVSACLLYTSDAADDTPCVDLGGRRIIKKKKKKIINMIRDLITIKLSKKREYTEFQDSR
eukprot:TRINITY_DN37851_c0_g1_i1.p3 TRINITY_DN37851_c0_g1~~TRINITY_DN37851_c0_g1_i1.p3  ORF type:complete len:132 (-),score=37.57 TRINITY_DN37851_c0_g1_i1:29-424(-)